MWIYCGYRNCSLNSLKGEYVGGHMGEYRGILGVQTMANCAISASNNHSEPC